MGHHTDDYFKRFQFSMFCQHGELPSGIPWADPGLLIRIYRQICPCREQDPQWISRLLSQVISKNQVLYFPHIYRRYGEKVYAMAVTELLEYRKVKGSFGFWRAIRRAVDKSYIGISGNAAVVVLTDEGWEEFIKETPNAPWQTLGTKLIEAAVDKVGDVAKEGLQDSVLKSMKMSEHARLQFSRAMGYLAMIGILSMLWESSKANDLAKMNKSDEKATDYRVRFFIGLLAKGPDFYSNYMRYKTYDRAHHRLRAYVNLEYELKTSSSHPSRTGEAKMNPVASGRDLKENWYVPADSGIVQ